MHYFNNYSHLIWRRLRRRWWRSGGGGRRWRGWEGWKRRKVNCYGRYYRRLALPVWVSVTRGIEEGVSLSSSNLISEGLLSKGLFLACAGRHLLAPRSPSAPTISSNFEISIIYYKKDSPIISMLLDFKSITVFISIQVIHFQWLMILVLPRKSIRRGFSPLGRQRIARNISNRVRSTRYQKSLNMTREV